MAKRYIFPQQYGERKKAKLNVAVTDHNFPLSQNFGNGKDGKQINTWGDDNDDEFLLLASQACEDAYNVSELPDYSMCMQPSSTSTQNNKPIPSTSKTVFTFKRPASSPLSGVTTKLKDKCDRISSPLPGMSKVCNTYGINVSNDIIINDNLHKDSDHVYRQLLKLQEENTKLKSNNGKLLEKCVTKEGEASILRTQLKSSQIAIDNARLEKIKVQERIQTEWSDKLTAINNQMHDMRTQLDFKNLEIISIKEKCKMLESNKVKLMEVTVCGNDISMSQRHNNVNAGYNVLTPHTKKLKTASSSVQTDGKSHFIRLNILTREESSKLSQILPHIMKPMSDECCVLDYNEKLRQPTKASKCRIYSTQHRLPSTHRVCKKANRKRTQLNCICDILSKMAASSDQRVEDVLTIFDTAKEMLQDVQHDLEVLSQRMTTAFQREMDEKYIEVTANLLIVGKEDLLSAHALYKEEQAILTRRMIAVLVYVLEDSRCGDVFSNQLRENGSRWEMDFVNTISRICTTLDNATCAVLYSGVLLSVTLLLKKLISQTSACGASILEIAKTVILSRPMPFVTCELLKLFSELHTGDSVKGLCCDAAVGNLRVDNDQGVLLYRRETCTLQVLLKQMESTLKCTERQGIAEQSMDITRNLILLCGGRSSHTDDQQEKHRCDCQLVLMQVTVYGLSVCAKVLSADTCTDFSLKNDILAVCRSGVQVLYRRAIRDAEFVSQLGHNEGHLLELCETLRGFEHPDNYSKILTEITSAFQSTPEELPTTYHQQAWLDSFRDFRLAD